jgi:hypothetical protein
MTDYTEVNLEVLRSRQPALRAIGLETSEDPPAFEIAATPSGYPTARLGGAYLHSRYDPMKEARRIVAGGGNAAPSAGVVLGFGLGYLAEAFPDHHPGEGCSLALGSPGV